MVLAYTSLNIGKGNHDIKNSLGRQKYPCGAKKFELQAITCFISWFGDYFVEK